MSDTSQGEGWWIAADDKWYPPEQHPDYVAAAATDPVSPAAPTPDFAAETVSVTSTPSSAPATSASTGPTSQAGDAATGAYSSDANAGPNFGLPAVEESPSSRRGLILGLGALVLIAGLCFLGFRLLNGSSSAGGASSPEAAIDQLIASVNERDAVGFVDVFDPDEFEAWFGSFAPAIANFDDVDADDEATNDLANAYQSIFDSFDYTLTGPGGDAMTYSVEVLDDNGRISRVRIDGLDFELKLAEVENTLIVGLGGSATALDLSSVDGTRIELRDERSGLAARLLVPGEPAEEEFGPDAHVDLITVQKDGKWFVSMGYTFLEIARNQGEFDGYPRPDFGRGFALVDDQTGGAESPEQVVQTMFTAFESLDYESIIKITDPYATPYLHDYQPLIDSDVNDADRQDAAREANLRFDELELAVSEWEGRTLVTTGDIRGTGRQDVSFAIDTTTWCATIQDEFDRQRLCLEDGISELLLEIDSDLDPRDFIPEQTGFIVIQRNGRWYLDYLGTLGFYADQVAEISGTIADEFADEREESFASEFSAFFFTEGPIARRDMPATTQANLGSAGVALDLSGYSEINTDFNSYNVAVAQVVTDEPGNFQSFDDVPVTGEDWVVAYATTESNVDSPAIAVITNGSLEVELFEVQITEVGLEGFSGQLGDQGQPQILTFTEDARDAIITLDGALADSVVGFESNGVVLKRPDGSSIFGGDAFTVIYGEPGAAFTINVDLFEPEPEPTPTPPPLPVPSAITGNIVGDQFALFLGSTGFEYERSVAGGFFDGCNGPDDPDVTSYEYVRGNELMVLTVYPSADRAQDSFGALLDVSTPCAAFDRIEVTQITSIDSSNTLIEWSLADDLTATNYEHYRRSGDTIVVATSQSLEGIEQQLDLLDGW